MTAIVKTYESKELTHWLYGRYRVTTYPNSDLLYVVLANKTHKRVVGKNIEKDIRTALASVK